MSTDDPIHTLRDATRGLRVALVHDWLRAMRGGEKVLEHVCALFPDAPIHTLLCEPDRIGSALRTRKIREAPLFARFPALKRHYPKLLPVFPSLVERFPTADCDLVISTSHCVAKGTPSPERGVHLSYVFTPMRYVWDHFDDYLSGRTLPDLALRAVRGRLQEWDRRTAGLVDAFAADSAHIAGKIDRFWGRRATVIHPPAETDFFTPDPDASAEEGDYYLVVGALVPYKRIERAIAATRQTGDRLVIVGEGPERAFLEEVAHDRVTFRGWVGREELRAAYRGCRALLYPGIEDYGIAAVEAMACGRPVVALRGGGVSETVLEGVCGAFFDDPSEEALAERLTNLRPRDYDSRSIRAHAERFSPSRFRRELARWILDQGPFECR